MTRKNPIDVVTRVQRYLDGQDSAENLVRWYLAESHRVAGLQKEEYAAGDRLVLDPSEDKEEEAMSEMYLDLDMYEPNEELRGDAMIDEKELRIRLERQLRILRDIQQTKSTR